MLPLFYNSFMKVLVAVLSNSVTPWTIACQAPLSMEFSQQEAGVGAIPSSRGPSSLHVNAGFELESPALQMDSLLFEPLESPQ